MDLEAIADREVDLETRCDIHQAVDDVLEEFPRPFGLVTCSVAIIDARVHGTA
jgi:hypothetical protein